MMTSLCLVLALAAGADKQSPSPEKGPTGVVIVDGRMVVSGPQFKGTADRIHMDAKAGTVTLEAAEGKTVSLSFTNGVAGKTHFAAAKRIIYHYREDIAQIEGASHVESQSGP